MTPDGDRPLAECLATFWQGTFTVREPAADEPAEPLPLEALGASGISVGGRDLAVLLAPVYRRLTSGS
jgi:hypothetical protein